MPENLISKDNLEPIVEMYEGNFSLLMNDIEVAKQANLEEKTYTQYFSQKLLKTTLNFSKKCKKETFLQRLR